MTKVAINGISRDSAAALARSPMPGNGLWLVSRHRRQIAHIGPADKIAPHLPNLPPSARGVQEFHLVFEFEGGDPRCRPGGAISEGQAVDGKGQPMAEVKPMQIRFTKANNGVITDSVTGLDWYIGPNQDNNWRQAKAWADSQTWYRK